MHDRCPVSTKLNAFAADRELFFCHFPFWRKQRNARRIHLHFHHMRQPIRHVSVISRWLQPHASTCTLTFINTRSFLLLLHTQTLSLYFSLFLLDILLHRRCLAATILPSYIFHIYLPDIQTEKNDVLRSIYTPNRYYSQSYLYFRVSILNCIRAVISNYFTRKILHYGFSYWHKKKFFYFTNKRYWNCVFYFFTYRFPTLFLLYCTFTYFLYNIIEMQLLNNVICIKI